MLSMKPLKVFIRKATPADVPRIKELWDSLIAFNKMHCGHGRGIFRYRKDKGAIYLEFMKIQLRRRNAVVFVAELGDNVVGHVMVEVQKLPRIYIHDKNAHVGEIVVDERYRGRGIGSALLEEAERWAKKKGMYSIGLMVHTANLGALSVYKKSGFVEHHLKMAKIVK
jgi:ribosomal protein S18 acetylase RimI-like enzyme